MIHNARVDSGATIGMRAVISDFSVVGEGALVGARALVTEGTYVTPHTLWIGAPARYKRDLTRDEIARLKQSPKNYVKYAQEFIDEQSFLDRPELP
jgi:carbonic anhydrase/acetyltransferase-like protein (isoleucine patch superfamily)